MDEGRASRQAAPATAITALVARARGGDTDATYRRHLPTPPTDDAW